MTWVSSAIVFIETKTSCFNIIKYFKYEIFVKNYLDIRYMIQVVSTCVTSCSRA